MAERLVGRPRQRAPKASEEQLRERLEKRMTLLEGKAARTHRQLMGLKAKMNKAKGPALARLKQQAKQLVKRHKVYSNEILKLETHLLNSDIRESAMENTAIAIQSYDALKASGKAMKKLGKQIKPEAVERAVGNLEEEQMKAEEVNEILSATGMEELDDDDLEEELAALLDDDEMEGEFEDDEQTDELDRLERELAGQEEVYPIAPKTGTGKKKDKDEDKDGAAGAVVPV